MNYHISKIAVIGSGVMGSGIAALVAGVGIPVVMLDIVPAEVSDSEKAQGLTKDSPRFRNRFSQAGKERVIHPKNGVIFSPAMADYITVGNLEDDLNQIKDCDWVVEVVAENLEIKKSLFSRLAPLMKANAILSTNTSGIPIDSIAQSLPQGLRQRFLGTHFFNPPRYMRLLELIPGKETVPELMDFMESFCYTRLGKGVVRAKDTPNFIGNRIGSLQLPLILKLMEQYGFDIETVDDLTGPLIGNPKTAVFRLMDVVGLDIALNVNKNLTDAIHSEAEKQLFSLPEWVWQMANEGRLGNKTGQGFYKRAADKKTTLIWSPQKNEYIEGTRPSIPFVESAKAQRSLKKRLAELVYSPEPAGKLLWDYFKAVLLYSANRIPEIADSHQDIDRAMRWGYNWGAGPFEIWDLLGFEKAAQRMKEEGETLPQWVNQRLEQGKPFYEKEEETATSTYPLLKKREHSALLDMGDSVLALEIRSPGNAISNRLRAEIEEALDLVENSAQYLGLVLLNTGPHFLTGANLGEIQEHIEAGRFEELQQDIAGFQGTSLRLKYAKKPVIAAVHGLALGGGVEFSMHCPRIVAHAESYMGLVEAGVGLIPGGGGAKEMLLRAMEETHASGSANPMPAILKKWQTIAMAVVSKNAYHAKELGFLRETDKIVMQIDLLVQTAKEEVLRMHQDGYRQQLPKEIKVPGTSGYAALAAVIDGMVDGGFVSAYDGVVAREIARAITGGSVPKNTVLSEKEILALEQQGFATLCRNAKTLERINGMMKTGRAVRN